MTKLLLVTPPFTQLNTPYPATAYLKGYLQQFGHQVVQFDLGLETMLSLFSSTSLTALFARVDPQTLSEDGRRLFALRQNYIQTIDLVVEFLQGGQDTHAQRLVQEGYLPQGKHFMQESDLDYSFGILGLRDKARHLCTLYLEDLTVFIQDHLDPNFGFSRYAEHLGRYATSFDTLAEQLLTPQSFVDELMIAQLEQSILQHRPQVIGLSIPFPGNLFSALRCGQWLKVHHPEVTLVMGGGFVNTELRSLTEPRLFDYVDYVLMDDGEAPFERLLNFLEGNVDEQALLRTYLRRQGVVVYVEHPEHKDVPFAQLPAPDYTGLSPHRYLSLIDILNPMHKLWSDGYWNKLTLAHGCYWGKCAFCDGSLDYIKRYEPAQAAALVDRMEQVIAQTGLRGFHFVDEAAPPKVVKELALEILRRGLQVTWWTNVRFERSFTPDLCRLLALSGCIGVSGGLEIASDRLLKRINKGVTVAQVARVAYDFTQAGILVHAYLMYGFPTQTMQETIDSLEHVRQLFEQGVVQSAFWHRFAMTAHAPVGLNPSQYGADALPIEFQGFADNDRFFEDPQGANHDLFGAPLRKSLYNYLHGVGLDFPLQDWFDFRIPKTKVPKRFISDAILKGEPHRRPSQRMLWTGGGVLTTQHSPEELHFEIHTPASVIEFTLEATLGHVLSEALAQMTLEQTYTLAQFEEVIAPYCSRGFEDFWQQEAMQDLLATGLLIL